MLNPEEDGITHINIYSKGKTKLGRLLANFANTPFKHSIYGNFQSVEGFWYWLQIYNSGPVSPRLYAKELEKLRKLSGYQAKKYGKSIKDNIDFTDRVQSEEEFKEDVLEAIRCKLSQNKEILSLLYSSSLPLKHYYWYGKAGKYKTYSLEEYDWMVNEIERCRDLIKEKYKEM